MGVTIGTDQDEEDIVWMTPQQVAKEFGVTVRAVRAWGERGDLPSLKLPNGRRRYPKAAVDSYFAANFRRRGSGSTGSSDTHELPGQGRLPV